jgi:hypothetical protein
MEVGLPPCHQGQARKEDILVAAVVAVEVDICQVAVVVVVAVAVVAVTVVAAALVARPNRALLLRPWSILFTIVGYPPSTDSWIYLP